MASRLLVLVVSAVMLTPLLNTSTDATVTNKPESIKGDDLIRERLRANESITETLIVANQT